MTSITWSRLTMIIHQLDHFLFTRVIHWHSAFTALFSYFHRRLRLPLFQLELGHMLIINNMSTRGSLLHNHHQHSIIIPLSSSSSFFTSPVCGGWVYPALRAPSPRCRLLRTPGFEMSQTSGKGAGWGKRRESGMRQEDEETERRKQSMKCYSISTWNKPGTSPVKKANLRLEKCFDSLAHGLMYPSSGPPFIRSKTWAGLRSCLNLRRNFTPWLSPLLELTRTRRGLVHDAEVAFQKPERKVCTWVNHFWNKLSKWAFLMRDLSK